MFRKAFTLIELLIVIAIIALLVSIIVPAMKKAKEQAKRMVCGTNLHQIQIACVAYANENKDMFPTRGKKYSGYPHAMINTETNQSLDTTFFEPYLSNMRDKVLFCPGALIRYRNPQIAQYDYTYITYQYFNYPIGSTMWISANQPNLAKYSTARQASPLWACLTVSEDGVVDSKTGKDLTHLSHNMVNEPHLPDGMNGVSVAGDTAWAKWDQCSPYLNLMPASSSRALKFYYPKSQ
jgi:prepilin-type N-terminal cleavage/methylation domain-containing protein